MCGLGLALVLLEGHEAEDTAEVSLGDIASIHVFVGDLCQGTHCILCGFHVLGAERLITHRDSLDHTNRAGQEGLEGLSGEDVGESTQAIGNRVFDKVTLSMLWLANDFEELFGQLCHSICVILKARVVNKVAPEAENVE